MVQCQGQMMSIVGDSRKDGEGQCGEISHHTIQNGAQFKLMNCLLLEFSI